MKLALWEDLEMTFDEKRLQAYEQGYDRVAGLDSRVLGLVEGLGVGEGSSDILWEWSKGWDSAKMDDDFDFDVLKGSEIEEGDLSEL